MFMKKLKQNNIGIIILLIIFIMIIGQSCIVKAETKNNDPMLKDIKINGDEIKPKFDMFTTEYVITVPEQTTRIRIEAIPDDTNANVELIGNYNNLSIGRNQIEIKVTAEDGVSMQSYYIFVTRGNSENTNANLKLLSVENCELAPEFNANTIQYAFEYRENLNTIKIEAIPEDNEATVEIIGNKNFSRDSVQTIKVQVTARDKQTVKTYYLIAKNAGIDIEKQNEEENNVMSDEKMSKKEISEKIPLKFVIYIVIIMIGIIQLKIFIIFFEKRKSNRGK